MACETKLWLMLLLFAATYMQHFTHGEPQVPCLFIFGDSSSDNGNNNYLPASIKANYLPYGTDFPHGTTGRFTNGKTTVDIIGQLLGFPHFIPPFSNTTNSDILKGVNYASAGGGIRDETGMNLGEVFGLRKQINNHNTIFFKIEEELGSVDKAREYLKQCLYYVDLGTNDYVNNYFLPQIYTTQANYTPEQYAVVLNEQYYRYLKRLHSKYQARKYVLSGVGFLGCRPYQIATRGENGSCIQEINSAVQLFNERLISLVDQLNQEYSDSKFIFVNYTAIQSAAFPGFAVVNASCCPTEKFYGECKHNGTPCENRNQHVFFDGSHPSEAFNNIAAESSYNDPNGSFTYPTDIKQLVQSSLSIHETESMMYTSI